MVRCECSGLRGNVDVALWLCTREPHGSETMLPAVHHALKIACSTTRYGSTPRASAPSSSSASPSSRHFRRSGCSSWRRFIAATTLLSLGAHLRRPISTSAVWAAAPIARSTPPTRRRRLAPSAPSAARYCELRNPTPETSLDGAHRWTAHILKGTAHIFKAHWDPACDGRCCPGRASSAGVPWHGLLSQSDGPSARPLRHALYGPRLEAPIRRKRGARDDDHGRGARVADHGRSRWRTRSAAAGFELQQRLVCLHAPPRASLPCVTLPLPSCPQRIILHDVRLRHGRVLQH